MTTRRFRAIAWAAIAGGCARSPAAPQGPRAIPVELAPVRKVPVDDVSEYVASMESRRSVDLRSEVDGRITRIPVKPGDSVRKGAVLVELDAGPQLAAVRNAQATLAAAQTSLRYAQDDFQRSWRLIRSAAISAQQFDQSRTSLRTAAANEAAQAETLQREEATLAYYRVAAPFDGVVGDIPVRVGDRITTSTTLTSVDRGDRLHVDIAVPVERRAALEPGLVVHLVDALGNTVDSTTIDFIAPRADPVLQSVLVKAMLQNPSGALLPDQFTRAQIVWSTEERLVIPTTAVMRLGGQPFAFVAERDGDRLVARQRPLQLERIVKNQYVVLGGLGADEQVVSAGAQKLSDGVPIRAGS